MITPQSLDLSTLPSVTLERRCELPQESGIYFAIDTENVVQYIGLSKNIQRRWLQHHRYDVLATIDGVRIAYLLVSDVTLLPEIEAALIEWFQPILNGKRLLLFAEIEPCQEYSWVIRWRLRVLMAEKNISNKELAERSGLHRVTISNLKQFDSLSQIIGDVVDKLCKGLTAAYRERGDERVITPYDLIEFVSCSERAAS